jgi:hypothetical protein
MRGRIYEAGPFEREAAELLVRRFFLDLVGDAAGPHATHWVEDTPTNLVHARELLQLFPDARLVHIHRDPRDVLASYLTFRWGGDDAVAVARRLDGIYRRWSAVRDELPRGRFLEVSLEQLGADPSKGLDAVCRFCGLVPDPRVLATPFDRVHAGRWRSELDARTLREVEPILGPWVEAAQPAPRAAPGIAPDRGSRGTCRTRRRPCSSGPCPARSSAG